MRGEKPPTRVSPWRRVLPSVSTLVFLAMATAFFAFLATRFEIDGGAVWDGVRNSSPLMLLLALLSYYASLFVRGVRWRAILKASDRGRNFGDTLPTAMACFRYVLLGRFADSITWMRLGHVYRAYLAASVSRDRFPHAMGTLVAEHLLDVLVVAATVVALAALLAGAGTSGLLADTSLAVAILAALVLLALALMAVFGPRLERLLPSSWGSVYGHFHRGTLGALRAREMPALLGLSAAIWVLSIGRWYFVIDALGLSVGLPLLLFVTIANAVLASVPITPGGVGLVEPGVTALLVLQLTPEQAVSVTMVERSISYLSLLAVGALVFFGQHLYRRPLLRR